MLINATDTKPHRKMPTIHTPVGSCLNSPQRMRTWRQCPELPRSLLQLWDSQTSDGCSRSRLKHHLNIDNLELWTRSDTLHLSNKFYLQIQQTKHHLLNTYLRHTTSKDVQQFSMDRSIETRLPYCKCLAKIT